MKNIVVLTGAGISAESGLKTFRDSDGLWEGYDIEEVATPQAWQRNPQLVQDFYNMRRKAVLEAKPNAAHYALARLEEKYKVTIITQNIDDLHQASGVASDHVIELHGNTTYARCIGCGQAYPLDWVKRRFYEEGAAPSCTVCDEPVKTATISFGQMMPEDEMQRATALSQDCDLFIAIGSSLVVWPAAGFPMMAKESGARLVIVNREPTEQDDIADLVIRHDIGETLGPFVGN